MGETGHGVTVGTITGIQNSSAAGKETPQGFMQPLCTQVQVPHNALESSAVAS